MPVLTRLPLAPQSILQLVKCGCVKRSCNRRCSCQEHNVQCIELCTLIPVQTWTPYLTMNQIQMPNSDKVTRLSTHLPGSTPVVHTVNNHAIHVSYLYGLSWTYRLFRCLEYSNMKVIFGCMFILNLLTIQFWSKSMKQ